MLRTHCKSASPIACIVLLSFMGGCGGRGGEPEYRAMDGSLAAINLQSGTVTFRFLHEKSGKQREHRGVVPVETEILINGQLSELSDIVVGERVSVVWRIEKLGARQVNTALKIHVTRVVAESSP